MRDEYGSPQYLIRREQRNDNIRRAIWASCIVIVVGLIALSIYMLIMADANAKKDFKKDCETKGGYTVTSNTWTDCRDKDTGYIIQQRGR